MILAGKLLGCLADQRDDPVVFADDLHEHIGLFVIGLIQNESGDLIIHPCHLRNIPDRKAVSANSASLPPL